MVGFFLSFVLLVAGATALARSVGRSFAERFWLFVASLALQQGTISVACSALGHLQPAVWLIVQSVVFAVVLTIARLARSRRSLDGPAAASADKAPAQTEAWVLSRQSAWLSVALGILLSVAIGFSALGQYLRPLNGIDERNYHGSRCMYWIQNRSLFPFETHNDRQTNFPFGAELFFMWPVLFTHAELAGRMVYWLGYPLSVLGVYCLMRELTSGRNSSLAGALIYAVTPTILIHANGLKPEMWTALFTTGIAFWALHAYRRPAQGPWQFYWIGVFFALSLNVRFTTMALLPLMGLLPWLVAPCRQKAQSLFRMGLGMVAGLALSGVLVVLLHNVRTQGHLIGGPGMQRLGRADLSLHQLCTHAVRIPLFLFEFPVLPSPSLRANLTWLGNECLARAGADMLPWEECPVWPGRFNFTVPEHASKYSLGGLVWLFGLAAGAGLVLVDLIRSFPRLCLRPISVLVLLAGLLFVPIAFVVRWMGEGPDRFWIAPYALGLPVGLVLLGRCAPCTRLRRVAAVIVLALLVYYPLKDDFPNLRYLRHIPAAQQWWLNEPYPEVLAALPTGANVLLVCDQAFRDYPLFGPHQGYPNRVFPWGQRPWDPARMQHLLTEHAITHIVLTDDRELAFFESPALDTRSMVRWLGQQSELTEVPLRAEHVRLFRTARTGTSAL